MRGIESACIVPRAHARERSRQERSSPRPSIIPGILPVNLNPISGGPVTCIGGRLPHLRPTTPAINPARRSATQSRQIPPPRPRDSRWTRASAAWRRRSASQTHLRRRALPAAIVPPPGEHRVTPVPRGLLARLALREGCGAVPQWLPARDAHHPAFALVHVQHASPRKCWSEHWHAGSRDTGIRSRGAVVACFSQPSDLFLVFRLAFSFRVNVCSAVSSILPDLGKLSLSSFFISHTPLYWI